MNYIHFKALRSFAKTLYSDAMVLLMVLLMADICSNRILKTHISASALQCMRELRIKKQQPQRVLHSTPLAVFANTRSSYRCKAFKNQYFSLLLLLSLQCIDGHHKAYQDFSKDGS